MSQLGLWVVILVLCWMFVFACSRCRASSESVMSNVCSVFWLVCGRMALCAIVYRVRDSMIAATGQMRVVSR